MALRLRPGGNWAGSRARLKNVVRMIESGKLANKNKRVDFGALLHIGDRRVCQLLLSLRGDLTARL
jgi:hypothetical protein